MSPPTGKTYRIGYFEEYLYIPVSLLIFSTVIFIAGWIIRLLFVSLTKSLLTLFRIDCLSAKTH